MAIEPIDGWHREILTADQRRALSLSCAVLRGRKFFLAGGTALALRFGHRRSRDLDWFTTEDVDHLALGAEFSRQPGVRIVHAEPGTIHAEIEGVPISLIR